MTHVTDTTTTPAPTTTSGPSRRFAAIGLGVFTALHGIAHFVGLTEHLQHADDGVAGEYLGGLWTISDPSTLRALAVLWAVIGAVYIGVGVLVAQRHRLARQFFVAITAVSLVLTVLGTWAAIIGVVVNVALLALALVPATAARFFDERR